MAVGDITIKSVEYKPYEKLFIIKYTLPEGLDPNTKLFTNENGITTEFGKYQINLYSGWPDETYENIDNYICYINNVTDASCTTVEMKYRDRLKPNANGMFAIKITVQAYKDEYGYVAVGTPGSHIEVYKNPSEVKDVSIVQNDYDHSKYTVTWNAKKTNEEDVVYVYPETEEYIEGLSRGVPNLRESLGVQSKTYYTDEDGTNHCDLILYELGKYHICIERRCGILSTKDSVTYSIEPADFVPAFRHKLARVIADPNSLVDAVGEWISEDSIKLMWPLVDKKVDYFKVTTKVQEWTLKEEDLTTIYPYSKDTDHEYPYSAVVLDNVFGFYPDKEMGLSIRAVREFKDIDDRKYINNVCRYYSKQIKPVISKEYTYDDDNNLVTSIGSFGTLSDTFNEDGPGLYEKNVEINVQLKHFTGAALAQADRYEELDEEEDNN